MARERWTFCLWKNEITEEKKFSAIRTASNETSAVKYLPEDSCQAHIPPQVTLEAVLLNLVGSPLLNMSKALDPGVQGSLPCSTLTRGCSDFHLKT